MTSPPIRKDKARWNGVAEAEPKIWWLDRSDIASRFIRPGDVVLDLGAGAQTLKRFLPDSVGYIPVDCVKKHPDTWVADFDTPDFELPDKSFNVITCLGVFTHLENPMVLLARLANSYPGTFIIYTDHIRRRDIRFERFISNIAHAGTLHDQSIFTGVLSPTATNTPSRPSLGTLICSHTSPFAFAAARWELVVRKWQRRKKYGPTRAVPPNTPVPTPQS